MIGTHRHPERHCRVAQVIKAERRESCVRSRVTRALVSVGDVEPAAPLGREHERVAVTREVVADRMLVEQFRAAHQGPGSDPSGSTVSGNSSALSSRRVSMRSAMSTRASTAHGF